MKAIVLFSLFAVIFAVGHWKKIPVDQDNVINAANFASSSLSKRLNSPFHSKLARVHEAEQQIVAGINYRLKITLGLTQCKKSDFDYEKIDTCEFQEGLFQRCKVTVYHQLDGQYKLSHFHCNPVSGKDGSLHQEHREREMFSNYMIKYGKRYSNEKEKEQRFNVFQQNLKKIKILNDHEAGTAEYGVTKFADLTEEEFKKQALGFRPDLLHKSPVLRQDEIPNTPLPESFDWRTKNIVSEVKNQGQCGSCWAFSTTGNIEGQWALKKKKLVSLSEQELVDCDKVDEGCNGGLPSNAYKEIMRLGGLEGEKDYPYEGEDEKCNLKKKEIRVYINDSVAISSNETEMAQWLVKNGPISIGINANAMQFYFGGISHPWKFLCSPSSIDHGVLIVGYGVHTYPIFKKTIPFWIIKNSWGASWGEQGYYRVYRGDGTCGLNTMATSAIID